MRWNILEANDCCVGYQMDHPLSSTFTSRRCAAGKAGLCKDSLSYIRIRVPKMRILPFFLALVISPSVALGQSHERRFVLVVLQVLEAGQLHSLPFENNTFTTEAGCEKAGQKLQQQAAKASAKSPIIYFCLDRGSAT